MAIATIETEALVDSPLVNLLVHVTNDSGQTGIGECWWGVPARGNQAPDAAIRATAVIVDTILAPICMGRDETNIAALWYELTRMGQRWGDGMLMCALSGIDLALWDLAGKRHGVPVVELLGGAVHNELAAYASLPRLHTEEALTTEITRAQAAGFRAVKLHDYEADLIEHAVSVSDDIEVMVDVNGRFSVEEAIALLPMLEALGVVWFEEPVSPMRDVNALARVKAAGSLPIAAGENEWSFLDADRMLRSGAVDYYQPEITKIGGMTAAIRHAALSEVHNVAFAPHNFRVGPSLGASMQIGFACPRTAWIELPWVPEGLIFSAADKYGYTLPAVTNGTVAAPTTPGL